MERQKITPEVALSGKKTFYAKRWQQNGYYPIDKFVWNEEQNAWEQFVQKTSGWHSYGCAYAKPLTLENGDVINSYSWWHYIFTHSSFILCYDEMTDNHNYNLD